MTNEPHSYTIQLPFHDLFKKEGTGKEKDFLDSLARLANSHAPNTIKSHFRHKHSILPTAKNGDTLYLLSKGVFNGKNYTCFATSGDKYTEENYVIKVSDEPYKMY